MKTNWFRMTAVVVAVLALALLGPTDARAQGAIASGETVTGTISPAGDSDSWTFTANSGDAIVIRVGEITQTGSFVPRIRLFNPSATLLTTSSGAAAAEIAVTAAASGTFTVIVDDAVGTTATGTYRLSLARTGSAVTVSPGDEGGPLTNGAVHTGTIDVGDLDVWTLTANAGDAIVVRAGEVSGGSTLTPWLRLYSPTGALLDASFAASAAEVSATAPGNGTYLVVVGDGTSGIAGSGAYRMTLAQTGSAVTVSPSDEGGPLTNGAVHTGTIDVGDLDVWTLTASTGDAIVVRAGEVNSGSALTPWLRLYSPTGALLDADFAAGAAEVAATAPANGTYLVVVGDGTSGIAGSGAYRMTLAHSGSAVAVSLGDEGGPLTNGALHTGTIDVGDLDVWTLAASTGEAIVVRAGEVNSGSALTPWVRLYSPTGALLDSGFAAGAAEVAATAPANGTYLVVVGDGTSGIAGAGPYRLNLAKTGSAVTVSPSDEGGPLTNGALHTGTIDVGDLDVWTLTANTGDAIVVRAGEVNGGSALTPWVRLYSPTGALLDSGFAAGAAEVLATAPASGTYLVVVGDGTSGLVGSGGYRMTLALTGSAVTVSSSDEGGPLTNGAVHTGTIDVGDLDVWTLTAGVGDAIVVRAGEVSSGSALTPWLRLYSPTGALLSASFSGAAAEVTATAPANGTYLVVVGDGTSGLAGAGGYRMTLATTGAAVTVSPGDEGGPLTNGLMHAGIVDVGDLDVWTLTASAGDAIVVRAGEVNGGSTLTPWLRLYSPTGALLGTSFSGGAAEVLAAAAPVNGTYLVVVGDGTSGLVGAGPYRLTLAKTGSAVAVSPGDEGGSLANGAIAGFIDIGDLDAWTAAVNVGDNLVVTMTETNAGSPLTPWVRIYSPSGALLGSNSGAATAQVSTIAAVGGSFLVVAGDASSGLANAGAYGLTLSGATGSTTTPVLVGASSRRVHGANGTYDLPLSLGTTTPTIEPRQGPAQNVVFTFDKPIASATVTIGEGVATPAAPTFTGNAVVVALTGVANQQYVTISLTDVAASDGTTGGSGSVRIGYLLGDVNQSRVVTVSDVGLVNVQLAQVVSAGNYLKDVNASGTLTVSDKGITNTQLTNSLPPP